MSGFDNYFFSSIRPDLVRRDLILAQVPENFGEALEFRFGLRVNFLT